MNGREFLKASGVVLLAAVFLLGSSPIQAADPQLVTVLVV